MDANIFIQSYHALYPYDIFPSLWDKLILQREKIILIDPIFNEIDPISREDNKKLSIDKKREKHPLRMWLIENNFCGLAIDDEVDEESLTLEKHYKTRNSDQNRGANSNDIKLIVYAKINNKTVVTYENPQKPTPDMKMYNYRIPLICEQQKVTCITFVDFLRACSIEV